MRPIVDTIECQRDSPFFRQILDENERNLESLEHKLEKIIKQCSLMVASGKVFNHEQEQLVHSMWELSGYFSRDSTVQGALNCLLDALREAANYHKILIDQAARAIINNFNGFIKEEVRGLKEKRQWFEKASLEMDSAIQRAATQTKSTDCDDMTKQLFATRQAFRHTSLDYMHALSMAQAHKRYEVVDAILSYSKAFSTFYHQGSDLCNDLKPSFDKISKEVVDMRAEAAELGRSMENRHADISGRPVLLNTEHLAECFSRDSSGPVVMQGYLFKRNNNAFKSWNRRYFTLSNNQLVYRKRSGEDVTVMEEDLRLCSVKAASDVERRFCFEVTSNLKSHVLQAESEETCQMWMEALSTAISSAIQHDHRPAGSPHVTRGMLGTPQGAAHGSQGTSPTLSPAVNKQSPSGESPAPAKVWQCVLGVPGNSTCCDCGHPDPKWASINIGVTLCIECSGIHRSLGVHYSKVRSLTLDKWDPEVVRVMEHMGNSVVNQIYLSNPPGCGNSGASRTGLTPAAPDSSRAVREAWIKAKYLDKAFVAPISQEEAFAKIFNHPKTSLRRFENRMTQESRKGAPPEAPHGLVSSDSSSSTSSLDPGVDAHGEVPSFDASQNVLRMESLTPSSLLLTASSLGHLPLMSLAQALGAHKDHRAHDGTTPLHHAVSSRSAIAVEYLLLNGVQVNLQDDQGFTPLHLATIANNILQVYRLIKYRANWKMKDREGKTPVDHAVQTSEPDLVTLLRVATLSEQLDKEEVEEEMMTIMQDLYRNKNYLLDSPDE